MEFEFTYDEGTKILVKKYFGNVSLDDVINSWLFAIDNYYFEKPLKGIISDYLNAKITFHYKDSSKVAEFFKQHIHYFGGLKIAVVTEDPESIVYPILVKKYDLGYKSKEFTTIDAAINWILEL